MLTEEGSHGDRVVFDPSDFDDARIGPAAWGLARFCVSLFLTADYCRDILEGRSTPSSGVDLAGLAAPRRSGSGQLSQSLLKAKQKACEAIVDKPQRRMKVLSQFTGSMPWAPYTIRRQGARRRRGLPLPEFARPGRGDFRRPPALPASAKPLTAARARISRRSDRRHQTIRE